MGNDSVVTRPPMTPRELKEWWDGVLSAFRRLLRRARGGEA